MSTNLSDNIMMTSAPAVSHHHAVVTSSSQQPSIHANVFGTDPASMGAMGSMIATGQDLQAYFSSSQYQHPSAPQPHQQSMHLSSGTALHTVIPTTQALQEWSGQGGWTSSAPFAMHTAPPATLSTLATAPQTRYGSAGPVSPNRETKPGIHGSPAPLATVTDIAPISSPQLGLGGSGKVSKKRTSSEISGAAVSQAKKSINPPLTHPSTSPAPSDKPALSTGSMTARRVPIVPAAIAAAVASVGMNMTDEELAAASVVESNGQRRFACPFQNCTKIFSTSGHLSRHIKGHSGAKPYSCPIPGCTSKFSRHDNMMQHYRSHTRRVASPYQYGSPAFYSSIYRPFLHHSQPSTSADPTTDLPSHAINPSQSSTQYPQHHPGPQTTYLSQLSHANSPPSMTSASTTSSAQTSPFLNGHQQQQQQQGQSFGSGYAGGFLGQGGGDNAAAQNQFSMAAAAAASADAAALLQNLGVLGNQQGGER
ncbi:hypothetical protein HDU67_002222 [Dinochytrium kinnereticum]|nr:hypothetical protein HDU67_002222 [Dinochytrium kinnereticum]